MSVRSMQVSFTHSFTRDLYTIITLVFLLLLSLGLPQELFRSMVFTNSLVSNVLSLWFSVEEIMSTDTYVQVPANSCW